MGVILFKVDTVTLGKLPQRGNTAMKNFQSNSVQQMVEFHSRVISFQTERITVDHILILAENLVYHQTKYSENMTLFKTSLERWKKHQHFS